MLDKPQKVAQCVGWGVGDVALLNGAVVAVVEMFRVGSDFGVIGSVIVAVQKAAPGSLFPMIGVALLIGA